MDQQRIFLSAVSSEFRTARASLAKTLRGRPLIVQEQDSFINEPGSATLLARLHDHIEACDKVVAFIGTRNGSSPPSAAAAEFRHLLPDDLTQSPYGITEPSYTQWEVIFALHYRRHGFVAIRAAKKYEPEDLGTPDEQQTRFVDWLIKARGIDLTTSAESGLEFQSHALISLGDFWTAPKPDNLPYRSIGRLFIGRDDFLPRLRTSLRRAAGGATAIVHGLGGIGKTRAAVEYALRHADEYTALLFLRASDPAALDSQIAALAGVLRLPEDASPDDNVRRQAVLAWLASHAGWLLILDNADSPDAVREADKLARSLRLGHVILTSRLTEFPLGIESLGLDLLTLDDAARYLLTATEGGRRAEPDDAARARELAEALDRLTLGLVHAGAYISVTKLSFSGYLALWHANRGKVLNWANEAVTGYPMSLAQTWVTSVEQLTEAGRGLLERLSFFANDPVPEFLLGVPLPGAEMAEGLEPLLDLQRFSLVARDADAERFTIHRIVRDVTNRLLSTNPAAHKARLIEALGWINVAFVGDPHDVLTWPRLDPLAPHAETLAWAADKARIAEPTGRVMNDLGVLFHAKAQHAREEPLKRRALAIGESNLGPDHPEVAIRLNNLAGLLQATNRLAEAEPLLRRALAIGIATLGPDHPRVAIRLNNLAQLLQATNRLVEAEPLMRRALRVDEATFGPDHPKVAIRLNNLAELLRATSRTEDAELLIRRALAIGEANFGPDHPDVAAYLSKLAQLLKATLRLEEAEPLMRRALAIDEASFGPDHPNVATDLNNLAQLLKATNRLAEAEPLMRRARAIDEAILGPDHPTVANDLHNLAVLLQATDRLGEAEPLMVRAVAISEASLGPNHPEVAIRLNSLALLLLSTNRLAEAEPLMRRHLVIFLAFQRVTGHPHPYRDAAINHYATLLSSMGRGRGGIRLALRDAYREPSESLRLGHSLR